jgi:Zn-dependent protease
MNMDTLALIALMAIPIIIAITFHEAAHGYVANFFGDDTAKRAGRVTLNPIKHIDPFGTVIMPALLMLFTGFMFGYAKPVPVEEGRLRNPRLHVIFVAAAGAAMNLILAFVSVLLFYATAVIYGPELPQWAVRAFYYSVVVNFILAIFNMIPIPPLDGSKVVAPLLPDAVARHYVRLEGVGIVLLLLVLIVLPLAGAQFGMDLDIFYRIVIDPAYDAAAWLLAQFGLGFEQS